MAKSERRQALWSIQVGDVSNDRAVVWSRANGASGLVVEWTGNERFDARRGDSPYAVGCSKVAENAHGRHILYGPDLDVLVPDTRAFRAAKGSSDQHRRRSATSWLGDIQMQWLKDRLRCATATWKVVAVDMPLGLISSERSNGRCVQAETVDGSLRARQSDVAHLLRHIKAAGVRNVVWLTADVHYCAALYYDPAAARVTDFKPFWEFTAGPLHAGSSGPCELDDTFGPTSVFQRTAPRDRADFPPSEDFQSFGQVDIEPGGPVTVSFTDQDGSLLFAQVLEPAPV